MCYLEYKASVMFAVQVTWLYLGMQNNLRGILDCIGIRNCPVNSRNVRWESYMGFESGRNIHHNLKDNENMMSISRSKIENNRPDYSQLL